MKAVLTYINQSKWLPLLLVFVGTLAIILFTLPDLLLSPNTILLAPNGDGLKSYYVFHYHLNFDSTINHFNGMNYPYGENYLFTDGFPALCFFLQFLPFLSEYHVGIIHISIIVNFLLTAIFLFFILQYYTKSAWISILGALALFVLQPQFNRLFGHLSLSYSCFFPMGWYFMIRFLHDENKWKWTILLCLTNFCWFFTHGYLGFMLSVFIGIMLLFYIREWKKLSFLIQVFLFLVVPLFTFFIVSKWSDSITDRTTEPFGFFEYQAEWKTIFFPSVGPIHDLFASKIDFSQTNWEGFSYIGMTSGFTILILLCISVYRLLIKNKKQLIPIELLLALLASGVLLIYSFGFPFNQFPQLLEFFEPLKQFRAIGRFAWPFYYVCGIISFVFMHHIYISARNSYFKFLFLGYIGLGSMFYFVEAYPLVNQHRTFSKNPFKKQNLAIEQQKLIQYITINKDKFQCILPLPWFHIGSELYAKEPNPITMGNVLIASAHTGLPVYSCMLGRTSLSQTQFFFRSLGSNYQEKSVNTSLNAKDLLVWFDYQPLFSEDELELYQLSTPLIKNSWGELRSLSPKKLMEKRTQNSDLLVEAKTHKQSDFLFEDYSSKNNKISGKASEFNTLAKLDNTKLKPNSWYEVGFDYYWKGTKNLDNVFRIEYIKNKQVTWFYERTISSYTDQRTNLVRVRAVFKTQIDSCGYNFFLFGGEHKNNTYEIDNLLIRPLNLSVKWKDDNSKTHINSF